MANAVMLSKTRDAYFVSAKFSVSLLLLASLASHVVHAAVPVEESLQGNKPTAGTVSQDSSSTRDRFSSVGRDSVADGTRFRTIEPIATEDKYDDDLWGRSDPLGAANLTQVQQGVNAPGEFLQDGSLSQMFYQMQVLQQELQILRGKVEEQQYLIENLRRDQKEQYVDLDGRVAALASNRPAPPPGSTGQGTSGVKSPLAPGKVWTTEHAAYSAAIDLMRAKEFEPSIAGFEGIIVNFPNGKYTPNAFYWLGELYLAQNNAEKARQNFVQVVRLYPDHQKVPGALYKLGVLYHGLGDDKQAKTYLDKVQAVFPQSSAAKLADKYARAIN
jgi:tol-pal system protein YbgF